MLIKNNEDALRIKCEDVSTEEVSSLILTLETELERCNKFGDQGIGLAAPQIGVGKNIAIIRLGNLSYNLVNCKIIKFYDSFIFRQEGCLSFPGRVEDTKRFQEVYIENNLCYPNKFIATGLLAVICQHELDHLNSTLFIDHKISKIENKKNKLGPNDLCFCGKIDGLTNKVKKYKKCCGK